MADANDKGPQSGAEGNSISAAPVRRRPARAASKDIADPSGRSDPDNSPAARDEPRGARVVNLQPRSDRAGADEADASRRASTDRAAEVERRARQPQRAPDELDDVGAAIAARARRSLEERYIANGAEYRFRSEPTRIAFKDEGKRLTTEFNTAEVARGMVDAAESKGWKSLQVKGTEEFKRQVWMEAELRGLGTRGYQPTEFDREQLDKERAVRIAQNSVMERWRGKAPHEMGFRDASGREVSPPGQEVSGGQERAAGAERGSRRQVPEQVVAMGPAPYKFDQQEDPSYYIRLRNGRGEEREVWGADLKRAAEVANVKVGDAVRLNRIGSDPVVVDGNVRDENNRVVGRALKPSHFNRWDIEKVDVARDAPREALEEVMAKKGVPEPMRAQVRDVAEARLADQAAEGRTPKVQMYDPAAPRETPRPARQLEPSRQLDRGTPNRG